MPPRLKSNPNHESKFQLYLPAKVRDGFKAAVGKMGTNMSEELRRFVREYIEDVERRFGQ
jgi:hypothetical protein